MFEIKIFANPTGYTELRLSNPNPIFSQEIVDRINFDSGDATTFNSGTYSIFYAPDVYVLTHHFDVSSEANFREKRVHIAIALKRGTALKNVCDVFESLKEHFQNLAKTYKDSIQSVLYNDSHSFRAIVQNAVVVDDYQLRINLLESRKAIIAYETSEQLKHLLATPNRRDFSGYNHIYIIPRAEAEQRWPFIKQSYSHIPISSYAYTLTYDLKFPDGHTITIVNPTEEIRYECSIKYYKTRLFEGVVKEHFEDWSIIRTGDGGVLEIPVTALQADVKEYKIQFVDGTGRLIKPHKGNIDFEGIGEYNASTGVLKLAGKSLGWEEKNNPSPRWSTQDYRVIKLEPYGNPVAGFNVVLECYYDYRIILSRHLEYFKGKVGDYPARIYFCYNGNQEVVDEKTLQMSWYKPYLPTSVEIIYPDTPQFNAVAIKFDAKNNAFPFPKLESKPSQKVFIDITNPNVKLSNVRYSYSFGGDRFEEINSVYDLPIVINWKAGKSLYLRIEASGYQMFERRYESIPSDAKIEVTLEKTRLSKLKLPLLFLICGVIVFLAGAYCGFAHQDSLKKTIRSEQDQILNNKEAEIDSLNALIKSYKDEIDRLQTQIVNSDAIAAENLRERNDRITKLKKKLKTTPNFTIDDIKEYEGLIGTQDDLSKAARYCLDVINIKKKSDRAAITDTNSELYKKLMHIKGHTGGLLYNRIMVDGDYKEKGDQTWQAAYFTVDPPTGGFKTVQAAYNEYEKTHKK